MFFNEKHCEKGILLSQREEQCYPQERNNVKVKYIFKMFKIWGSDSITTEKGTILKKRYFVRMQEIVWNWIEHNGERHNINEKMFSRMREIVRKWFSYHWERNNKKVSIILEDVLFCEIVILLSQSKEQY